MKRGNCYVGYPLGRASRQAGNAYTADKQPEKQHALLGSRRPDPPAEREKCLTPSRRRIEIIVRLVICIIIWRHLASLASSASEPFINRTSARSHDPDETDWPVWRPPAASIGMCLGRRGRFMLKALEKRSRSNRELLEKYRALRSFRSRFRRHVSTVGRDY